MTERKPFLTHAHDLLASDIYEGKINGMQTAEIAAKYGISKRVTLTLLKSIVAGEVWAPEYPFGEYNESMGGVEIKDGTTFTYGDNPDWGEKRQGNNHYHWFSH